MNTNVAKIVNEVEKVISGKREVVEKILTAILAGGHVLLDDIPGIGKTTMAVAISRSLGLKFGRIQFTPDVTASDIVGFSMYNKGRDAFEYKPGIAVGVNLLLGDEINRTSSKTQSALLEAMEEGQVTVDGGTHPLENPFIVIATQNNVGTAGTQMLPYAQLDRFLVKLSIGYPDLKSEIAVIQGRQGANPLENVEQILGVDDVVKMQNEVADVTVSEPIVSYIARLSEASRAHELLELGISPRGSLFVNKMAKARAYAAGRDFVIGEDVQGVFVDTCAHRVLLSPAALAGKITATAALLALLNEVKVPDGKK
ncbi:MAG: MoxR family ATPase [Defluviitaleaceae bacterium]|nr:MoxR family ATPase [Defluviitaleaceae bacterium]